METLGMIIRYNRYKSRLNQIQLAKLLGVGQSTICLWEKDKETPNRENLQKLCGAFDLDFNELSQFTKDEKPKKSPKLSKKTQQIIILYPYIPNKCLSEMFGLSYKYIESFATRFKLRKRHRERFNSLKENPHKERTDITKEMIIESRENGESWYSFCFRHSISDATYYRKLNEK